jgi:hypothetical protein
MANLKSNPPEMVTIKGHELVCPVCSNKTFWQGRAQLNTAVASLFNLDWTNHSATYFVCSSCTHISWFYGE